MTTKGMKQKKNHMNEKEQGKVIFALLCALVFFPPFFTGLFFQSEILLTHIFSFGLFITYLIGKITKAQKITLDSPFDYIGGLLIVAYILPIISFQWANLRDAIGMVLWHTNLFVVYLMVKEYAKEEKYKRWILDAVILSGVGTAIIGILGAVGLVSLPDVVLGNRIASTFQYPNTLAAFMMMLFFIVIGRQSEEEVFWRKSLYAVSGFLMLFTFIFTYSRAAWMLLPVFALLYIAFAPGKVRIDSIFYMIAVAVPNILILQPFTRALSGEVGQSRGIVVVAIGIMIFAGLYTGLEVLKKKLTDKHHRLIYILLGVIFVAAGGFVYAALNITEPLTFDNTNVSENRTNQIQRTIQQVEPLSQYELQLQVESISVEEDQWPWRVQIHGVNETGDRQLLEQRVGELNESGEIIIPFDTLEETTDLIVYFRNQYPETIVTFERAILYDAQGNLIEDVPLSYKYLPETLMSRFNAIDLSESSSTTRFAFYRDSITIFMDHPLVGAGGGAWSGIYTAYQSEPYFSTEAHNYYLQTLVETGIIGILLLIVLMALIIVVGFKAMKTKDTLQYSIVIGILALLGHSALDFNFSYLSIALSLWVLIALLDISLLSNIHLFKLDKLKEKQLGTGIQLTVAVLLLPLLFVSFSLYGAQRSYAQGLYAAQTGDYQGAYESFQRSVSQDTFNENFRIGYAQILTNVVSEDGQDDFIRGAEEHLLNAERYAPYSPDVKSRLINYYASIGNFEKTEAYIESLLNIAPLRESTYELKANVYSAIGGLYLENGEEELALEMYEKVLEVVEDLRNTNQELEKPFALTETMMNQVFRARYTIENIDNKALLANLDQMVLSAYLDINVTDEMKLPKGWWTWNREGGNIQVDVIEEGAIVANNGTDLGILLSSRFELEPSKTYGIDVQITSDVNEDDIQVVVHSRSGTATQFSQRPLGEPVEANVYRFTFETTDDIEPGGQDIRFYHYGNNDESFTVKQIMIYEIE